MNNMQSIKKKYSVLNTVPIIISLLALCVTSYYWSSNNSSSQSSVERGYAISTPPVFLALEPFTVTLPKKHKEYVLSKILYIGMILRVADEKQKNTLMAYLPEVRSKLLLLLANQNVDELNTETGKLKLIELVKQLLSRQYNKSSPVKVDDVLLTDFIIR